MRPMRIRKLRCQSVGNFEHSRMVNPCRRITRHEADFTWLGQPSYRYGKVCAYGDVRIQLSALLVPWFRSRRVVGGRTSVRVSAPSDTCGRPVGRFTNPYGLL